MRAWPLLLILLSCGSDDERRVGVPLDPGPEQERPVDRPDTELAPSEEEEETPALLSETETVTVYYRHPLVNALVPRERRIFSHVGAAGRIKQVIDQLSIAPEDGYGEPIWPATTHVREVYLLETGTLVVDFNREFLDRVGVGAEQEYLMVYSLVNSLVDSFAEVERVYVLIEGGVSESLLGHIDIEDSLTRRMRDVVVPDNPAESRLQEESLPLGRPVPANEEGHL